MFIKDGKRFNIYAAVTTEDTQYPAGFFRDPQARAEFGIEEIPDPLRMPDETHFNQELDEAPYLVSTPKPQDMVDQHENYKLVARIEEIESRQMRALREAILSGDVSKLKKIDDDIAALRVKLKTAKTGPDTNK